MNRDQLALALATVAVVPAVFSATLPPLAVVHGAPDSDSVRHGQRSAVALAGALSLGVGLAAGSPLVAVAGLTTTAALALLYARAIAA